MTPNHGLLARLRGDRSGATAVITGVLSVAILGFVGLGTDLGVAYAQRRAAQSAADSAAYSAAVAHMTGAANAADQGRAVAATYGFKNGVDGMRVTVSHPTSGPLAGEERAYEVKVEQPMRRFFSGLFDKQDRTVGARAVAVAGAAGNGCIIAFNPTDAQSALNNGTGAVNLSNCSLYVNSASPQGFTQNGSGSFSALSYNLVASNYLNNGTGSVTGAMNKSQPAIPDPYADVSMPAPPPCDFTSLKVYSTGGEINPGTDGVMHFCGGLLLTGAYTYTFLPGVYFVSDANFSISGINTSVVAKNVTFVLTSRGSSYARLQVNGLNNALDMSAPTSGPLAGILFFQDRAAPTGAAYTNVVNGKANATTLTGALYFKKQTVTINGAGNTTDAKCTQILADKVVFNGSASTFKMECSGAGVRSVGGFKTALVE